MANRKSEAGTNSQVKSKKRVRDHGEVFTAEREVKAMCDLISEDMYSDLTKTFLEPACGEGAFLVEVLRRKLKYCESEKDGLKALHSLYGVDIQADNVEATRKNLIAVYIERFPNATDVAIKTAIAVVRYNIVCDDFLNPKTEAVRSWGVTANADYVKAIERLKSRS